MSDKRISWEPSFSLGRSAEADLGRRLLRVISKKGRLILVAAAIPVIAFFVLSSSKSAPTMADPFPSTGAELASPTIAPTGGVTYAEGLAGSSYEPVEGKELRGETASRAPAASESNKRVYAIALSDLTGLPPDAAPGTVIDLWVTWQPPVRKQPNVQPLLQSVMIKGISPPFTPDGPYVVDLLVDQKDLSDLLYGDRFGSLSASVHS